MRKNNQRGFSLIEILMVLILIAVLAAIAINAFINFRVEARDAALRGNLSVLRKAIAAQIGNLQLRCGADALAFPNLAALNANNITAAGNGCTAAEVATVSEQSFVQGTIPVPPQGIVNTVIACAGAGCTRGDATKCDGAAGAFTNQWCYNTATGEIWLDSATVALEAY